MAEPNSASLARMHPKLLHYLVCPVSGSPLQLTRPTFEGEFIRSGELVSYTGPSYPIRDFVPRFTAEAYAKSFTVEWEKHPSILHQSTSNMTLYETRFAKETRWPDDLSGQAVLEAGCGPGALTRYPLDRGATVVSFDLSDSVTRARQMIGPSPRSLIIQASIFQLPFRPRVFDRTFCFGVLQHTPDPERAFRALVDTLKPGGSIAADSYIVPDPKLGGGHRLVRAKYRFRKLQLSRIPPRLLHLLVRLYVSIVFSLHSRAKGDQVKMDQIRSLMLDDYAQRLTSMDEKHFKEFAILDIFDFLSPRYDIPQTVDSFRAIFERSGLTDIDVHPGYNGIEGRARKPDVS
jgi:SAM-dependent methyltransferase